MILGETYRQLKLIFFGKMERFKPQGVLCQKFSIFLQHGRKAAKNSLDRPSL
jgi:hypothetical protein